MSYVQTRAGDENIVVLNDNYLYEASTVAQVANARWVDLTNVMSVKRDKTIYAIRARNTYSFTPNVNQTVYFANDTQAYTLLQSNVTLEYNPSSLLNNSIFRSNIYRNFNTTAVDGSVTQGQNILMTGNSAVYGNVAAGATMNQLGICGSLKNTNFAYSDGANLINVSSNVLIYGNSQQARAPLIPWTASAFSSNLSTVNGNLLTLVPATSTELLKANINANGTCFQQVSYTNWNRLINANINANVFVNASTDPCDFNGAPVNVALGASGNVLTNEAYRHQFRLRANTQQTASANNPIYIARVSRFGTSLSDNNNNVYASKLSLHSFSNNFFASVPSDNQIYAGTNLITGISLSGNVKTPGQVVFNSNFTSGNLFNGERPFNGNRTDNLPAASNNDIYMKITQNPGQNSDFISGSGTILSANNDINMGGTDYFSKGDKFSFVQANVYLNRGYLLMDRISFTTNIPNFELASNVFRGNQFDPNPTLGLTNVGNYANLWISANLSTNPINQSNEVSAKYLQITGSNIIANNWQSSSLLQPTTLAIPTASQAPTFADYEIGDTLNLYLRRGSLSFMNRTYVENASLTGVPYGPQQVPGFITGMQWLNNNNIVLNSNILEANVSMTNFANAQVALPVILGANVAINANVACNYQIVVSGNVSEENRVNKNGNIVAPQNTANSFIANSWCYDNNGVFVAASDVRSNVIINYGGNTLYNGVNIQGLDLNSADANTTPQYTLVFGNTVGSSNSATTLNASNFVFFANVFSDGKYTPNVTVASSNVVMNNTPHIANLLIRDVAYSSFNLGTNSFKFTDDFGILPINIGSNFSYAHYLPEAVVNSNTSSVELSYKSSSDSYLNIITDYNVFNTLPGASSDVHQVTLYDFKYRYGVEQIKTNNGSLAPTQQFINGSLFDSSTNFLVNTGLTPGNNVNRVLTGNMEAPAVSVYVYENVNASFNYDAAYPFALPNSQGVVPLNANVFPAWKTLTTGGQTTYNGNNPSPDFVIPANTENLQKVRFHIHSQVAATQTNGTPYMVASMSLLQNGVAVSVQQKSIEMYPVIHGKATNGAKNYATPVLCGVAPANGGNSYSDYVIIMVELIGNGGVEANPINVSLVPELENSSTIIRILPTKSVNNVVRQQVSFSASLRSFPSGSGDALLDPVVNNTWNYLTPLLTQASSIDGGAPGSGLTVNLFRQPSNSAIFSYVYSASLPEELMSFTRTDHYLNGTIQGYNAGVSATTFASSSKNISTSEVPDTNFPSLPLISANASRYYLDNNAVYVDVSNLNTSNIPLGILNVARSIEWTLLKGSNQVGRGLISRDPTTNLTARASYTVYENFALSSGFVLNINTNITNLASRILLQQLTTNVNAQSSTQWTFNTKADSLNLTVVRMSATTQNYYDSTVANNRIKQGTLALTSSNSSYDLGSALAGISNAGKFISIAIRPVRGFNFNVYLSQAFSDALVAASAFSISLQPDSYAVAWVKSSLNATTGGKHVNGSNVLFSENNNVMGVSSVNDFVLNFANRTISSQFESTTSPVLSTSNFALIAKYEYNGFGQITYSMNNFTSNYNNQLKNLTLSSSGNRTPLGDPTLNEWKVPFSNAPSTTTNIKFNGSRYYFDIGTGNTADRIFFKQSNDLPYQINNKTTLLLYSGLRPLMLSVLEVGNDNSGLQTVISNAGLLQFLNTNKNIFTSIDSADIFSNPNLANPNNNVVATQNYQIVLTNAEAVASNVLFRSAKYAPTVAWFTNSDTTKNFYGSYVSSSQIFEDLVLTVSRSNNYSTRILVQANLDSASLANPQLSDNQIKELQNETQNNNAKTCYNIVGRNSDSSKGQLFNMNVNSTLSSVDGLVISINPATLTVYAAADSNNNGEIDTNSASNVNQSINGVTENFGLQNMYSELMFNLPNLPSATNSNLRNPTVVASWVLDRNYNNIPGAPFDILMNNKWSVGYNLDCLFTIQNNNCAQFDVITIATKLTTNASGAILNGLVVNPTSALIIKNPTDWARSLDTSIVNPSIQHPGLTFKLNTTKVVQAGSVVRLFVDNVITNNWLEWNVKTAASPPQGKSFKINLYDQTNYANLLNEQLNISNNFI
jgi:hypothetical protein